MSELHQMLGCALLTAAVTAVALQWLLRCEAVLPQDVANWRSLHAGSVPRIGGVAMAIGFVLSLSLHSLFIGHGDVAQTAVLTAAGLLAILSFADDWRALPVVPRLAAHLAAAIAVVVALDLPVQLAVPAVLAIVWMTNLYNFMDGTDGLAGLMALIGFGAYAIAAWPHAPTLAWWCVGVAAAAAGFLGFNFPPARVFMGDAGSIPLGFLAASFGLIGWQEAIWPAWFPLLVFLPFVADATLTLGRRLAGREAVWRAHRDHYYQRLVLMGWSHRRVAVAGAAAMAASAAVALLLLNLDDFGQWLGLFGWGVVTVASLAWVDCGWRRNGSSLNH
jgi:UDP-GlcNAc:undecaprenyl-phosphate/decaprenyl-phosphate GlcNAc-1-phosphate transferase